MKFEEYLPEPVEILSFESVDYLSTAVDDVQVQEVIKRDLEKFSGWGECEESLY